MALTDYHYDPDANVEYLIGLEKLRAVKDRGMAKQLYDLYVCLDSRGWPYERSNGAELKRQAEDLEDLQSMTDKALSGVYGRECKLVAESMVGMGRRDRGTLEELRRALRKVPGRLSG